jgi:hypothetical protein
MQVAEMTCSNRRFERFAKMEQPSWWAGALVLGLILSFVVPFTSLRAEGVDGGDVYLFLSPYCGISQQRFAEAVPLFPSLEHRGERLEFLLIALRGDRDELSMLQHLECANAQERFTPYFLFVSRAIREGRTVHHEHLAQAIGLDTEAFRRCVRDTAYSDAALERSRAIFDAYALRGVPSVIVKDTAFTFRGMQEVLELYSDK